jgi:hypothetical protein
MLAKAPSRFLLPKVMKTFKKVIAALVVLVLFASSVDASTNYKILSKSESDMIIEIRPEYRFDTIRTDASEFIRINFPNAVHASNAGAPMVPRLSLGFLLPSGTPLNVEVLEEVRSGAKTMLLAPYPTSVTTASGSEPRYEITSSYAQFVNGELVAKGDVTKARTAFAQRLTIEPVRYDASTHSVRLIESLKIRVRFYGKPSQVEAAPLTRAELDLFHSGYVNGDDAMFYRSAQAEVMREARLQAGTIAYKPAPQAVGEWLSIETDRDGIYKITAEDLRSAGITSTPDANSIELFGFGGRMLPENITDSSGEWRTVAIDARADGSGKLTEFYFYAPGVHQWKYQDRRDNLYGMYHLINAYMSVGKFMLKVGGERIAPEARVAHIADTISSELETATNIRTVAVRELERSFEVPNFSREMVGELLPREGIDPLTVDLSVLPGYLPDSTLVRVGTDGLLRQVSKINVSLNGKNLGTLNGDTSNEGDPRPKRNWEDMLVPDASFGKPERLSINYSTNDPDGRMWLNWVDVFYRAGTSIGSTSLPFYLVDTRQAYQYNFTNASGGAVWDVSNPYAPIAIAQDAGNGTIQAAIQGQENVLRQFVAFSAQSVLRVSGSKLARTSALSLRSTLGQQGMTNIIVAPEAFREQAEELRALREKGGQATEPVHSTVVLLEDIFKEFGYGAKDPVAIRDFMAYVYRHTMKNGTTVPMFLTLIGSGHVDYQNRVTDIAARIPVYELPSSEHVESLRNYSDKNTPDDSYYGRLTPKTGLAVMDPEIGVGRLSVQSADEAQDVIAKIRKYETSSAIGPWRARLSMIIDDRQAEGAGADPLDHLADANAAEASVPSKMQFNKVYGMNYQTVFTAGGRRKPEMEIAIDNAFNEGSVITGFIGHGNPKVWTHESILQVPSTINKMNNLDRLTFLAMATCDFAEYDNYEEVSGGVQMLTRANGGAVGLLGTSRSVFAGEGLYSKFIEGLLDVPCESAFGTTHLGTALVISKIGRTDINPVFFYLQGDPAMRLLVPKQYAIVDSINNKDVAEGVMMPALSEVKISGRISNTCDEIAGIDPSFNGTATITLFDTKTDVTRVTSFSTGYVKTDVISMEGPILYRGSATVRDGRFTANFIVPRDIKFDTNNAKISVIAFADDSRSALGAFERVRLAGSDPSFVISDTIGPELKVFIGTRAFKSGDIVPMNSNVIVDVKDDLGLNTSTASVGHSFIGWVDDASSKSVDMSENYVSEQDNFRVGTAVTRMMLPAGRHTLKVRAFDALNNPSFAEVEFVAKDSDPLKLYNATVYPNPVKDRMTVSFMHPLTDGSLVDATLDIYSSDGRLVRTIASPNTSGNIVEISWNGDDDTGASTSQGAYTYRISVTDQNDGRTASAFGSFVVVR